jgi:type VI secretion system (T6SS) phospholipase Tle1-like effector
MSTRPSQIVDCYAAIISVWEPDDRIYLFGFSRGAYAVRCVAHVLELIGIPQTKANGTTPLSLEPRSLRSVARAGVKRVYRLGLPKPDRTKRDREAGYFQTCHRCRIFSQHSVLPYCIAIWDAVGAVGWLHYGVSKFVRWMPFIGSGYDLHFPKHIKFARHALAIDEYRKDFVRVKWGGSGTMFGDSIDGVTRVRQVWFAGNHSDIGGSYPENESRLSDITLEWITTFISKELPAEGRVIVNKEVLRLYPLSAGMMHDELMVGHTRANVHIWPTGERKVDPEGELHETVIERLKMPSVRNYTGFGEYRPKSLSDHPKAKEYYKSLTNPPEMTGPTRS